MLEIKDLVVNRKDFCLNKVNLSLDGGYILGIIGRNGAGKTTLFQSIFDLIPITSGEIKVFGNDYWSLSSEEKNDIGFTMNDIPYLGSMKYKKLNKVFKKLYSNWSESTFHDNFIKYELPFNKKVAFFSTGMKAKLMLAIAFSHNAKLLILDEPTNGLDAIVRSEILDDIREFVNDDEHSVIISSHVSSDLEQICDYVAFIEKGQIKLVDSKDNLEEELRIITCSNEEVESIPEDAIINVKRNKEVSEVLVKKELVNTCFISKRPTLEEITIHMLARK